MSFENRLKRSLEARAADMEGDVTTALRYVREKGARRRRMQFAAAAVAAAALFATGAVAGPSMLEAVRGSDPNGGEIGSPNGTPSPPPSEAPTSTNTPTPPPPEGATLPLPVWFTSGEMLQTTTRFVTDTDPDVDVMGGAEANEIVMELLSGPNQREIDNGLGTAIPAGTLLRNLELEADQATVDLTQEFETPSDGDGTGQRVAQIVWTLSELAPDGVTITIEGEPLNLPGLGVEAPYTTDEFESLLLPITVWSPYAGQEVNGSGIHIRGTANVFEATVTIGIVDADGESLLVNKKGKTIDATFTTATCGTGCRGTFETTIQTAAIAETTEAFVEVYETSAENGEPINMVRIPVTLAPSGS